MLLRTVFPQEFFARLQRETGQEVVDLSNIWGVEDILYIENVTPGKSLPSWVQDGDLDKLISLAAYTLQLMYNTPEKHKITAGRYNCGTKHMHYSKILRSYSSLEGVTGLKFECAILLLLRCYID